MTYANTDLPLLDVVGAEGNHPLGHIALGEPDTQAAVTFCEFGDVLSIWAYTSGQLDPTGARNLAAELTAWADRRADLACRRETDTREIEETCDAEK